MKPLRISLIINTAAGDPYLVGRRNLYRQREYAERAEILRQIVAFSYGFDEVIVAGIPPAIEYPLPVSIVNVPPRKRDRSDALWQREIGARHASGDILVFTHDDHAPEPGFVERLRELDPQPMDLIVPQRVHGLTGATLNNGKADGYMGGHLLVMGRALWAKVPWVTWQTEWWDVPATRSWLDAGANLRFEDTLRHLDLEATAEEA